MNWQEIQVSQDGSHFLIDGKQIFDKQFIEALKFHSPGLAPVRDKTGAYHIDSMGNSLYTERFTRTFGFYCNRAAVMKGNEWFHISETGKRVYELSFSWTGNFQENLCAVRKDSSYFHINIHGKRISDVNFIY